VWEAWVTFALFFVFIGAAFTADRIGAAREKKRKEDAGEFDEQAAHMSADFTAIDLYRELVKEKQGEKAKSNEEA
jgi:hypothetical protein